MSEPDSDFDITMGNANVKVHPERAFPKRENGELFEVEDNNGFVVDERQVLLNEDVLIGILSQLSAKEILICRSVCKSWCNSIDTRVWKEKLMTSPYKDIFNRIRAFPWHVLFVVLHKQLLRRNFVKNPCGLESLNGWDIKSNGGDRFRIEIPPSGTEGDPPAPSCFATSYHSCSKAQIIDLYSQGACTEIIDILQPDIVVSEWYAGRFDCWAVYDIEVALLDDKLAVLDEVQERKHCGGDYGSEWRKIEFTFKNYPSSVRYVRFYHGGCDGQFWAGHYGSKMTGACVQLVLKEEAT